MASQYPHKSNIEQKYIQESQFRQLAQGIWDGTDEVVQVEIQADQISQIPKITRYQTTYIITVKLPVTRKPENESIPHIIPMTSLG